MHSVGQTKAVANKIVQSEMPDMGLVIPISEIVGKIVDKAFHKYRICDMEELSKTTFYDKPSIVRSLPCDKASKSTFRL